jgi:hypothetical protein
MQRNRLTSKSPSVISLLFLLAPIFPQWQIPKERRKKTADLAVRDEQLLSKTNDFKLHGVLWNIDQDLFIQPNALILLS